MKKMITIAVDAMGGDNSPLKIIDGIELHHKKSKNVFYKIFGNKNINLSEKVSSFSKFIYNFLFLVNLIKLL